MTDAQGANAELSAKRAQWQEWARQQFSGDEAQIQAAADAALRAALAGASSQEAAAAAREAAASGGATPVAGGPSGGSGYGSGHPPPRGSGPPATTPPPGHDASITRPSARSPWYRRPLVLLAIGVVIVLLIGLVIWGISSHLTGPSTPGTTTVVPATSSTQQPTTKRTRKRKSTSSTSPTPSETGSVTVTIPSTSP